MKPIIHYLPSMAVFLGSLFAKGSASTAQAIWDSWKPISFPMQDSHCTLAPGAIDALSWSLKKGISFTYNIFTNFDNGIYAPILWGMVFILIYYVLTNASQLNYALFRQKSLIPPDRSLMSKIMLLQLIAVSPLIILGWDWGRWIFYWATSSIAIYLLIPETKLVAALPPFIGTISYKLNTHLDSLLGRCSILFLALLIGFPQFSWDLSKSLENSAAGTFLISISTIIHQLVNWALGLLPQ